MRRLLPLLITGLLSVLATPAAAQVRFETLATSTTGYTSNSNPGGGVDDANADAFFEIGVGLTGLMRSGRVFHALRYDLAATIFVQNGEASSFANSLTYAGLFALTPRLRLGLGLTGTQGREGNFRAAPGAQVAQPRRAGEVWFVGLSGQQRLDWRLNTNWDLFQALAHEWYIPTDNPFGEAGDNPPGGKSMTTDVALGALRSWRSLAIGITQRSQYLLNYLERNERQDQWLFGLSATGRYDLSPNWTTGLELGVQISTAGAFNSAEPPGPLAIGSIGYRRRAGSATLTAGYDQTPNVQVQQILQGAFVTLSGALPVGPLRLRMQLDGAVGYTYSSPIGGADDAASIHTLGIDVAYNWRFSNVMEADLRYQFNLQRSAELTTAAGFTNDFDAHVVLFTLRFNYPPRRRRRRRSPRIGGSQRADREEWDAIFDPNPGRSRGSSGSGGGGSGGGSGSGSGGGSGGSGGGSR